MVSELASFHDMPNPECSNDVAGLLAVLAHGYCVESGTYLGKGARSMATGATLVDTVDPCWRCWEERPPLPENVQAHLQQGVDFVPSGPIDLLFIDSGWTTRSQELVHFQQYLAPDGLVIVDDAQLEPMVPDGYRWAKLTFLESNPVILARLR